MNLSVKWTMKNGSWYLLRSWEDEQLSYIRESKYTREKNKKFKEVQVFPEQSIRKQIMELHHQGKTPFEIAKEVDRGTGEVQLILNLLGEK